MAVIIRVKEVKSQDLKPGDLFSNAEMKHWGSVNQRTGDVLPLGEKVFIRTNAPTPENQIGLDMVRLTLEIVTEHASYHCDVGPDEEGTPTVEQSPNPNCPYCKGELVEDTDPQEKVQCPACEGQAEVDGKTCTGCDGTGTLAKEDFDASGH